MTTSKNIENENSGYSSISSCHTCSLAGSAEPNSLIVYKSNNIIVNHHSLDNPNKVRTGWFFVSPTRHMCRFFELSEPESSELTKVIKAMDESLTAILGAKRVLIASLGWNTFDHMHFHLVTIISEPVTYGYENFGPDRYIPLGSNPFTACKSVKNTLSEKMSL